MVRYRISYQGCILWPQAYACSNIFEKTKGLLGRKEISDEEAIIFFGSNSFHTFFMKFPIDIIFLNKKAKIVKLCAWVWPWRIVGSLRACIGIEVKAGMIEKYRLQNGAVLSLEKISLL